MVRKVVKGFVNLSGKTFGFKRKGNQPAIVKRMQLL